MPSPAQIRKRRGPNRVSRGTVGDSKNFPSIPPCFLKDEGIPVISSSTGGDHGRKIEFWPVSGRARQHPLSGAETQKTVAMETRPVPAPKPVANDIEFF